MSIIQAVRAIAVCCCLCCMVACSATTESRTTQLDPYLANYPTDFPITVSGVSPPTFSWSGVRGGALSVTEYGANTITPAETWSFSGSNPYVGFSSPVTYGTLPSGAYCGYADDASICPSAKPLLKGHIYMLVIISDNLKIGVKFFVAS